MDPRADFGWPLTILPTPDNPVRHWGTDAAVILVRAGLRAERRCGMRGSQHTACARDDERPVAFRIVARTCPELDSVTW